MPDAKTKAIMGQIAPGHRAAPRFPGGIIRCPPAEEPGIVQATEPPGGVSVKRQAAPFYGAGRPGTPGENRKGQALAFPAARVMRRAKAERMVRAIASLHSAFF